MHDAMFEHDVNIMLWLYGPAMVEERGGLLLTTRKERNEGVLGLAQPHSLSGTCLGIILQKSRASCALCTCVD